MIDYTFAENKGYSTTTNNNNPKKKAHCVAGKTIVVIDESLIKRLSINEDTWFEQQAVDSGILLRIYRQTTAQRENDAVTEIKEKKIDPQQAPHKRPANQIDPVIQTRIFWTTII